MAITRHIANSGIVKRAREARGKYRPNFQRYQNGKMTSVPRVNDSRKDLKIGIEQEKTPNPKRSFLGGLDWNVLEGELLVKR